MTFERSLTDDIESGNAQSPSLAGRASRCIGMPFDERGACSTKPSSHPRPCMLSFEGLKGVRQMRNRSTYPQGHRGSAPLAQAPVPLWVSAGHDGEYPLIGWLGVGTVWLSQGSDAKGGDAGWCDVWKDRFGESSIARCPSGSESRGRAFGVLDSPFVQSPNSCWLARLTGPRIRKEGN